MSTRQQRENELRVARYNKGRAAEAEVQRRLEKALDRLTVMLSFSEGSSGVIAHTLHAVHYIERGWADDSRTVPDEAPDFRLSHDEAEALARGLGSMLALARNARTTAGQAQ